MERVEKRLRKVTAALDTAQIPYAVIGGNAVASWVARADPEATRTTKDVDILVRRQDLQRISEAVTRLGFEKRDLRRMVLFIDPGAPSKKAGVHLVWAGEKVRSTYSQPAPTVEESVIAPEGFRVLNLAALVRMKLTSFRDIDRVHVADLLRVGLIDDAVRKSLPSDLTKRLRAIEATIDLDE
jgi:hypothetical protein